MNAVVIRNKSSVLFCPAVFGHCLDPPPPEIIPVGQFFRRWIKSINQSSVDFHCKLFDWLIDWLTISKLWLDWFIGFVPSDLFLGGGGGLKWPNTAGQYSMTSGELEDFSCYLATGWSQKVTIHVKWCQRTGRTLTRRLSFRISWNIVL